MKTKSQSCVFWSGVFMSALIVGILILGYFIFANMKKSTNEYESIKQLNI